MDEDPKPELLIHSWPTSLGKRPVALFVLLAILFCSFIDMPSISKKLIKLGNTEFSAGKQILGKINYDLAFGLNHHLNKTVQDCYLYATQKKYILSINACDLSLE